jgi:hypothetical protein
MTAIPYFGPGSCGPAHRRFMRRHKLTTAKGAAKGRRAHFGDSDGNAGREGCAQLPADKFRIRVIDLGGQRHNHRAGQAFLVTHRKLIPPGRPALPALALCGRLLDHPDQLTADRLSSA